MEVILFFCYLAVAYCIFKIYDGRRRESMLKDFHSKYVLITGCDSGFGKEFAERLDKLGCRVFAGCLTEKGEDELRKMSSDRLVTLPLDVTDHDSVTRAYRMVCDKLPQGKGLWGIANNAGIAGNNGPVEFLKVSDYQQVLNVNTLGMVDITTTFLPLIKKEHGRVVNMTSVAGRVSLGGMAPYCISKYAAEAFSDSLRRQMKVFKVSVHIIEPGFFKTNIVNAENVEQRIKALFQSAPKESQDEYGEQFVEHWLRAMKEKFSKINDKTELVVDAYEHAMLAQHPRARYVVGSDANYMLVPLQSFPTVVGDFLLKFMLSRDPPTPQVCKK